MSGVCRSTSPPTDKNLPWSIFQLVYINIQIQNSHIMTILLHVMTSHVMTSHVMTFHVMTFHVMAFHVMTFHVMTFHLPDPTNIIVSYDEYGRTQ